MKAKKGRFKVDFLDGVYEGYFYDEPGDRWNGHPCPFLTYESKERLLKDFQAYKTEYVETEDGFKTLFPIGSQMLRWEEVNDEDKSARR